jgi:two-component system, sensor histidine kinase LadS
MLMLRYVLAFIVLLGAGSALAQDRVVERLWLADPTGELTLVDVQSMPWQPAPRKLSRGYTADTVWMRLLVQVPDASPVAVNVWPSYLDDVRLHVPTPITLAVGWSV